MSRKYYSDFENQRSLIFKSSLLRRQLLFPTPKSQIYTDHSTRRDNIFVEFGICMTTLGNIMIRGHCDTNVVLWPLLFLSARPNFRYGLKAWNKFNSFLVERSVYIWDLETRVACGHRLLARILKEGVQFWYRKGGGGVRENVPLENL